MELSVIIVNWNVAPLLAACLESAGTHLRDVEHEVIVVDNASTDGSTELLRTRFPGVKVIGNTENVGFARAINQGVRASSGTHLWFLNPDTELTENSYSVLRSVLDTQSATGIAGPRLNDGSGVSAKGAGGRFPGLGSILNTALFLPRLFPRTRWAQGLWLSEDESTMRPIDWVSGAAMLTRRSVFEAIGGFDERFFLLCEDMDFCRRALDAGWTTRYVPETSVLHHEGRSIEQQDDDVLHARQASLHGYLEARHGALVTGMLTLPLKLSYFVRLAAASARYAVRRSDANHKHLLLVRKHLRTMS